MKSKSSFLTQILTAASSFSSPDVTATSSTATSTDRPSKFITSKPRTTVPVTKNPRNITFRSRKLPPKISFINITTGETTGYNTDDVNITTLPFLSNYYSCCVFECYNLCVQPVCLCEV